MQDRLFRKTAIPAPLGYPAQNTGAAHMGQAPAEIAVARTCAEFAALKDDWLALERECVEALNFFQTYDWLWCWYTSHENALTAANAELLIITTRSAGRLTSVWPLMIVNEAGMRVARWMSEPHLQYGDVLAIPDAERLGHLDRGWDALTTLKTWDTMVLSKCLNTSRLHNFLCRRDIQACNESAASMLDLSAYRTSDDFYASFHRSRRKRHNRRRKKLAELGALRFDVYTEGSDYARAVANAIELKRAWLVDNALHSQTIFHRDTQDFLSRFADCAPASSRHVAAVLSVGGKPAAIEIGFLKDNHYYSYLGAFDGTLRNYSPGKVHMAMMIEWCIDQGAEKYDLLGTCAQYKSEWTDTTIGMQDYCLDRTIWGSIYVRLWLGPLRQAAKRTLENLPVERRRKVLSLLRAAPGSKAGCRSTTSKETSAAKRSAAS